MDGIPSRIVNKITKPSEVNFWSVTSLFFMIAPSDTPNETYVVETPLHIA